jgi:hypothetical protein
MPINLFQFPAFDQRKVTVWYSKGISMHMMAIGGVKKEGFSLDDGYPLEKTHAAVVEYYTDNHKSLDVCESTFSLMQGEVWSPNGEARELIESLDGVNHTSMMVGDIVQIDDDLYLCATDFSAEGFVHIGKLHAGVIIPQKKQS